MFDNMEIFRMANALAVHSSARQAEVASNVANADTPGYRARDVAPFAEMYRSGKAAEQMRSSRASHFAAGLPARAELDVVVSGDGSTPNENTVSLPTEMIRAVEVRTAHETALSVYESARNILRTSLGRGR